MDNPVETADLPGSGKKINKPQTSEHISIFWVPVFLLPWFVLYLLTLWSYQTLPTPLLLKNEADNPHRFIAERAKWLNEELTAIGPRVLGTTGNEILAIQFLRREIEKIIEFRNPIHDITYDIQRSSGSLQLDSMTSVYQNIQNFIVKFTPAHRTPAKFLLLNSHFDSVPISPGGGDAATMIVVMMEVLRVLSQIPNTYEHGIVFLFNGAEEVGLQGSHMFISQHPWAANVKVVLNLDSAGTGGREIMFRATLDSNWLIRYYVANVIYPTATVLIDDLFEMKVIPSDTDFRIFRDHQGDEQIYGMDFSLYRNGYVYHTQFDRADKIPMGTYQNVGDNILSVAQAVANADELYGTTDGGTDRLIYFDYLGWFMICYTTTVSNVINGVVSLICLVGIVLSIQSHIKSTGLSCPMVWKQFGFIIIIQCISLVLAGAVLILLAIIYDAFYRSMSYFSHPWILFGIYICPLMFCLGLGCALHITFWKKKEIHVRFYVQLYLHAQSIFLIIILLAMAIYGIRTVFPVMLSLMFYSLTMFINFFSKLQLKDPYWTLVHFFGQAFPFVLLAYYTMLFLELFVPIQGRSGPDKNPDSIIAIIFLCFSVLMTGYLMPTFSLFKRPIIIVSVFFGVFICCIIIIATPIGFPFRALRSPQRFWIFDTQRIFHDIDGSIRKADNGYFMLTMDRHMQDYVIEFISELEMAEPTEEKCNNEMFCGMPLYTYRMIAQSKKSFWLPHTSPLNQDWPIKTELRLLTRVQTSTNVERLTFEISGPDHMTLFISPKLGNILTDWNLLDYIPKNAPKWGDRLAYFIFFGHGGTNRPLEFFIELEINNPTSGIVDVTVVGHYTHHVELETDEFRQFVDRFPDWAQVTPWMCTLESWIY